jgi:hypothetical protein
MLLQVGSEKHLSHFFLISCGILSGLVLPCDVVQCFPIVGSGQGDEREDKAFHSSFSHWDSVLQPGILTQETLWGIEMTSA